MASILQLPLLDAFVEQEGQVFHLAAAGVGFPVVGLRGCRFCLGEYGPADGGISSPAGRTAPLQQVVDVVESEELRDGAVQETHLPEKKVRRREQAVLVRLQILRLEEPLAAGLEPPF